MRLISHALAFGLGYTVSRPDGRQRLTELGRQTLELSRRPEVKRLRERGWDLAGDGLLAARNRLTARSRAADRAGQPGSERHSRRWRRSAPADPSTASARFRGGTGAEDPHDVMVGRR